MNWEEDEEVDPPMEPSDVNDLATFVVLRALPRERSLGPVLGRGGEGVSCRWMGR